MVQNFTNYASDFVKDISQPGFNLSEVKNIIVANKF